MPSKTPDFITRIQAEGTTAEKLLEKDELHKKVMELVKKLPAPPDRQVYVGNLLGQALRGELDKDVFKEFVKRTNTYLEVEEVAPRVKMLMKGGKGNERNTRGC